MLRGISFLFLTMVMMGKFGSSVSSEEERTGKPLIKKLGTIDCDLVETTPVVFHGRLYRFEYVRANYKLNKTGDSHSHFTHAYVNPAMPTSVSSMWNQVSPHLPSPPATTSAARTSKTTPSMSTASICGAVRRSRSSSPGIWKRGHPSPR